jgi:hypothetical protein
MRGRALSAKRVGEILTESFEARQDTKNALQLRDWLALEANRADSGEHLWSDFRFVLKKIGFCRAELRIGATERSFYLPQTPHDEPDQLWQENHRISETTELALYAEKQFFSEKQFELVSDIACEAWTKAAAQWQLSNESELTFEAQAKPAENYRAQKAKSLYRPTY